MVNLESPGASRKGFNYTKVLLRLVQRLLTILHERHLWERLRLYRLGSTGSYHFGQLIWCISFSVISNPSSLVLPSRVGPVYMPNTSFIANRVSTVDYTWLTADCTDPGDKWAQIASRGKYQCQRYDFWEPPWKHIYSTRYI